MSFKISQISLAEFSSLVCGAVGSPATAAEFRAMGWAQEGDWHIEDLRKSLAFRHLGLEPARWEDLTVGRQQPQAPVCVALSSQWVKVIRFDDFAQDYKVLDAVDKTVSGLEAFRALAATTEGGLALWRCRTNDVPTLAVIPGIERHWFWSTLWHNRSLYTQSGLAAMMTNIFALATSLFSMIVYNRIIPSNAMESLGVLVTGMMVVMVVDFIVRALRNRYLSIAALDSDLVLADRLFAQVMDLQYKAKKGSVGALANTLKDFEHIREFFASASMVTLIDLPFAIIFVSAILIIGGWMVLPVLIGIAILVAVTLYSQPRLKVLSRQHFEDGQSKHSVMVEALSGLETLKVLGAGGFMRRRLREVLERQSHVTEQTKDQTHLSTNVAQFVQQFVQMAIVAIGAVLVSDGQFAYGAIIACTILSGKALAPFAQFVQMLVRFNQINASYQALSELMKQPVEHPERAVFLPRGRLRGEIEFRSVTFTYPGQTVPALNNVSFHIQAGERLAILGHVGSGKTTISRLLAGLYAPDSGTILVDGIDIRQIAPSELRENLGLALQDVWLMSASVAQNISLGSVNVTPEDVLWAGEVSGVADFVNQHPEGYQQVMRERGESFSGGQRQAISLARALVRRPAMVLLDEPTSAMDTRTEQQFIQRLRQADLKSTLLIITHRTSLLPLVGRVMILERGQVSAIGSTDQFLQAQAQAQAQAKAQAASGAAS